MMRVIVAGSRTISSYDTVANTIRRSGFEITEIVSGGAKGVDRLGECYAANNGIPLKVFNANWSKYGKKAGNLRNKEMGDYANALVAIWDGSSTGTKHMIKYAKQKGLKVFIHNMEKNENVWIIPGRQDTSEVPTN